MVLKVTFKRQKDAKDDEKMSEEKPEKEPKEKYTPKPKRSHTKYPKMVGIIVATSLHCLLHD